MKQLPHPPQPAWAIVPMEDLLDFVRHWEKLKVQRNAEPEAFELSDLIGWDNFQIIESFDALALAARERAKTWLAAPAAPQGVLLDTSESQCAVSAAVLLLWEESLAIDENGPESKAAWLAALPSEARLLVNRLARHVPTKQP